MKEKTILFFAIAQFLFCAPAVRYVAAIGHKAADFRVLQTILADQFQMPPFTVFVLVAKLYFYRAFRVIERELKRLLHWQQIIGMQTREEILPAQFLRFVTQRTLDRRAGVEKVSVAAQNAEDVERIFRERAEIFFTANQFRFRRLEPGSFFGFLHGPADGGRQPIRLLLEQIIGRAGPQAFNRRLFADGAGNENERNMRIFFPHHGQRIQAGERRQVIVRNNNVKRTGIQCGLKRRAVANAFQLDVQTVLLEKRTNPLGEIRVVFQM